MLNRESGGWPNRNARQESREEVASLARLARAKILQGFQDLASNNKKDEFKRAKREARKWFFFDGGDLEFWCDMADLTVEKIRAKAQEIMVEGLNWRGK